mmetsp:Transcript_25064/g.50222  ORF Transcript_25064/g.50222 Transcript_25064/m.50222 type:complete len:229 (+) Transcript_25064:735-1421(+)
MLLLPTSKDSSLELCAVMAAASTSTPRLPRALLLRSRCTKFGEQETSCATFCAARLLMRLEARFSLVRVVIDPCIAEKRLIERLPSPLKERLRSCRFGKFWMSFAAQTTGFRAPLQFSAVRLVLQRIWTLLMSSSMTAVSLTSRVLRAGHAATTSHNVFAAAENGFPASTSSCSVLQPCNTSCQALSMELAPMSLLLRLRCSSDVHVARIFLRGCRLGPDIEFDARLR